MMQLQDTVNSISETLKTFVDNFNVWKEHVDGRLAQTGPMENVSPAFDHASPRQTFGGRGSTNEQLNSRIPTPIQARSQLSRVNSVKTESPVMPHSHMSPNHGAASTPIKMESYSAAPHPPATPAESVTTVQTMVSDSSKELTGLRSDHTTSAHLLLEEWAPMKEYCNDIPEIKRLLTTGKKIADYPMELEKDRGLLRVWGVGEGQDVNDGAHGPSSPESGVDSDAPSPASAKEGLWGMPRMGDHSSPSTVGGEIPRLFGPLGGNGPDGRPDFRGSTLSALYDSYMTNIHNLHPFLNPTKLRAMVKEFASVYNPDQKSYAMSPPGIPERPNAGMKRKRSSNMFGDGYVFANEMSKGGVERSLRNAIVLLVLALGKCCLHTDPLPHPLGDWSPTSNGAWGFTRDSPRSTSTSFSSDTSDSRPRNIDILPGMAYYSIATDILGNQQGGNTVGHAQAMLLAALYQGQYARVLESWSWINNASRVIMVLVKA